MKELTRKQVQEIRPKFAEAVRREDYPAFKELLTRLGIVAGSDRFRSLESQSWRAVAEYRKSRQQRP